MKRKGDTDGIHANNKLTGHHSPQNYTLFNLRGQLSSDSAAAQ